ncbi:SDR family oxidoreductase [Vibrio sp. Of7-15]|uniref:SDR family oxidoreductase n=1 Tax=Vibrio sp. Of7-15 TaxID=2724879 RepID=UPI001EF33D9C|nr:SDR family oxidoreductase [Vibrio sp. Of7-15]MCG7496236.1 SDR family oxidoreductase [Vibrio sp. Of7-15]
MEVKNGVFAITGAGQGLGREMAITLAKLGAQVALIDLNEEGLLETSTLCHEEGVKAVMYCMDVSDEEAVVNVFQRIVHDFGHLDGLINNAGLLRDGMLVKVKNDEVTKMSLDHFQAVMDVNVTGTFLCGREAAVRMIETGRHGVIINISSVSRAGNMGQTNYSASKAAVATMAVCWAKELGRYGIRAAAIAPGVIKTAMTDGMKPEARERLKQMVPLGRLGEAQEIAQSVRFIIENDYYTGRVLETDGGIRL